MRRISCMIVLVVLATIAGLAQGGLLSRKGNADVKPTTALADMLAGRWRFDVPDSDVPQQVWDALKARRGAENIALAMGESVIDGAVGILLAQRPVCAVELTQALHDGVFVGRLLIEQHGADVFSWLLGSPLQAVPVAEGSSEAQVPVTVECITLSTCVMALGSHADAGDAPPNVLEGTSATSHGRITVSLQRAPSDSLSTVRIGTAEWKGVSADGRSAIAASVLFPSVVTNNIVANLFVMNQSGPANSRLRLIGVRESESLDAPKESSWLGGSWQSLVFYVVLLGVIVGGRHAVKWYFRRQGVDVDAFVRNIRGGRRSNAMLEKLRGKHKYSDAEIMRMMDEDTARESWSNPKAKAKQS